VTIKYLGSFLGSDPLKTLASPKSASFMVKFEVTLEYQGEGVQSKKSFKKKKTLEKEV
jgi:hypothetical protein